MILLVLCTVIYIFTDTLIQSHPSILSCIIQGDPSPLDIVSVLSIKIELFNTVFRILELMDIFYLPGQSGKLS